MLLIGCSIPDLAGSEDYGVFGRMLCGKEEACHENPGVVARLWHMRVSGAKPEYEGVRRDGAAGDGAS